MKLMFLLTVVIVTGFVRGQATQPTSEPESTHRDNGLTMTNEQIRARMKALNKRAASQPAVPEAPAALQARQAAYQERKAAEALSYRKPLMEAEQQIRAIMDGGPRAIAVLPAAREEQQAERAYYRLLSSYHTALDSAVDSSRSFFSVDVNDQFGQKIGTLSGEATDPARAFSRMMLVESNYGPDLKPARELVVALYDNYRGLLQWERAYKKGLSEWNKQASYYRNNYNAALKASGDVGRQAVRAAEEQEKVDAYWLAESQKYLGVDVRRLWEQCAKDAKRVPGLDTADAVTSYTDQLYRARARAAADTALKASR